MFNSTNGYSLADIAAVAGSGAKDGFFGGSNGGLWVILLFIIFFMFGGNWGNGGRAANVGADLTYSFDTNGTHEGIRDLQSSMTNGFYALNTGMLNGFSGTNAAISNGVDAVRHDLCDLTYTSLQNTNNLLAAINADTIANMQNTFGLTTQMNNLASQQQNCCCETQRQLERDSAQLNYNLATLACDNKQATLDGTRSIIEAGNANTKAILDFLTQDRINALQAENAELKGAASQAAQNAYLIERLSPIANPAYIVANPYTGVIYPQNATGYANFGQFGCGCGC